MCPPSSSIDPAIAGSMEEDGGHISGHIYETCERNLHRTCQALRREILKRGMGSL